VALALVLVPTLLATAYALTRGGSGSAEGATAVGPKAAPETTRTEPERRENGRDRDEPGASVPPPPPPAESCDDLRVLVDRDNPLPAGYAPEDLVSLSAWGVPTLDGQEMLRRAAARQLGRLVEDAAAMGEELVVASAYRSYAEQQASYNNWTAYYGEGAGGVSAPPGHSQHQLGTAVDFTNAEAGYQLWWPFGDTSASAWLVQNAPRYGYVLAYPGGSDTPSTGYSWEPWHYRFIGVANARRWQESGLSLQEFLSREGVLPLCGAAG